MHRLVPKSLLRLGLPAVGGLLLILAACSDPAVPTPSEPPTPAGPSSPMAAHGSTGSDGLTVRYLGDDGTINTVRVEDFPR